MNYVFNKKIVFFLILVLATALRLWKLGSVPPGLTPDEAALGYNAYSVLTTGRDEHGNFLPVIFTSFADYKPGLYVYLTIPFVALFGLNEWSVRLPSALAGIISVFLIYLITNQLRTLSGFKKANLEIFAGFVAAFNPWLIHFSRGAWETNIVLTLTLAGIYFFLKSLQTSPFFLISTVFFCLTFLTYQGAKLSTPLVIVILVVVFWGEFKKLFVQNKKVFIKSFAVGLIIAFPILLSFLQGRTGRLSINSVFSYPRPVEYTGSFLQKANEKVGSFNYLTYHSEPLNFARGILGRWLNHYSGRFLFFEGDYQNPRHSSPNHGMLLLTDFILVPLGIFFLIKNNSKFSKLIFLWLLLAPLPAAFSRDQVHAVRALGMSVPLILISSFGLFYLYLLIKDLRFRTLIYFLMFLIFLGSFSYYLDSYYVHLPKHNAKYWFYGYKEAVLEIMPVAESYDKIVFQQSYSQPYIYFLFYGAKDYPEKFSPKVFQQQERFVGDSADVSLVNKLGNIEFQFFSWPPAVSDQKTLIVGDDVVIPSFYSTENFSLIKEIKYPNRLSTAFRIIENK